MPTSWKSRLSLAAALGTLLTAMPATMALAQDEKVVNVYNWSDYIAEDTVAKFEKETGIKVNYDVFDSNEIVEAKLLAGHSGYDVVVPSGFFLERQVKAGLFQPLDKSKLPNLKNMDPEIMKTVAGYDPGNAHAVDYMWGTTGLGFNSKAIADRLPGVATNNWDILFKPENAAKLKDCGITLLDAPDEIMSSALNYLGLDPNSESADDLKKGEALLMSIRPNIRYFHSSQYIGDLANGDVCLSVGYSGDVFQAQGRAKDAAKGVDIKYVIPSQGALMWFDMLAIPSDAPHADNAHKFINFIMEPQITADITNFVSYANGNAASLPLVKDEIKTDPAIYPPPALKSKLFLLKAHSAQYERLLTRAWTRIKTGQ